MIRCAVLSWAGGRFGHSQPALLQLWDSLISQLRRPGPSQRFTDLSHHRKQSSNCGPDRSDGQKQSCGRAEQREIQSINMAASIATINTVALVVTARTIVTTIWCSRMRRSLRSTDFGILTSSMDPLITKVLSVFESPTRYLNNRQPAPTIPNESTTASIPSFR